MPTSIVPSILAVPRWLFPTLRERSAHPVARESHRPSSRRFRLSNGGPLTSRGVRPSFFPVVPPRKSTAPLPSDPHQNEQERGGCGGRIVSCRLRGGRTPIHSQLLQRLLPRSNPASSVVASHGHTTPSPAGIYSQLRSFVRPCASCRGSAGRPPRNNLRSVRYIFFVGKCTTTRLQLTSIRSCDYAAGLMRHCLLLFVVD